MNTLSSPAGIDAFADCTHDYATVNGVRLHYVTAGQGNPVVLLPGWPQTWYAWRHVLPILAQHYQVLALDLRGMGDSDKPEQGYDTATVAADLFALTQELGWSKFRLVGHDVGAWVAYAYAASYPDTVPQLVLLDAAIPGVTSPEAFQLMPDSKTWQFVFHAVPDLPEQLIEGRERLYLSWFFQAKSVNKEAIQAADLDEYVRCYAAPGAMRAGFAYYRAVFEDIAQNQIHAQTHLNMPVLALGGEKATGTRLFQTIAKVASTVEGGMISNCGHYIPEECPDALCDRLLDFFTP